MDRDKVEMTAALVASGMVKVGDHANDPEGTARKSVRIARAIFTEIDIQFAAEAVHEDVTLHASANAE